MIITFFCRDVKGEMYNSSLWCGYNDFFNISTSIGDERLASPRHLTIRAPILECGGSTSPQGTRMSRRHTSRWPKQPYSCAMKSKLKSLVMGSGDGLPNMISPDLQPVHHRRSLVANNHTRWARPHLASHLSIRAVFPSFSSGGGGGGDDSLFGGGDDSLFESQ